jgi:GNAT superfamily N-acetyltransferase
MAKITAVRGARYVELGTALLQRMRLANATGGIWEAADLQWWSRYERSTEEYDQVFWLDAADEPIAAIMLTDWVHSLQCDVHVLPGSPGPERAEFERAAFELAEFERTVWRTALERIGDLGSAAVEFPVRDDNVTAIRELAAAGFGRCTERLVSCWLEAERRPRVSAVLPEPLPPGYRLRSRGEVLERPHHLIPRNGPGIARRLEMCSLYRQDLDLLVEAPDGQVAGYGLFWADPVTRVGLVEPMRTEEPHQRRGIARHILATGLDRLAALGCDRLKVGNDIDLYLGAGFRPLTTASATTYTKD